MTLIEIDKEIYRKNLNVVIVSFVASFAVLALLFGQLLIAQFGQADGSNFKLNLFGVVIALIICSLVLSRCKNSEFFKEIYYVWQLKQLQNAIYRKVAKVKPEALSGNVTALQIMDFYYRSLAQVYELDNNTLTMTELTKNHQEIKDKAESHQLDIETTTLEKSVLSQF